MSQRRKYAARTAILGFAVVLATAGCGDPTGGAPAPDATPKEDATVDSAPATGPAALGCGQPFRSPTAGPLALSGQLPATATPAERAVTGTVEVTSAVPVRGVSTRGADVFLVRDGRIVTVPETQDAAGTRLDLVAGRAERLPGAATLVSCQPGGGPLPPGRYEMYARVVLTGDDGTAVASFGGPWPLQVR